jgi:hypothetical protein
VKSTYYHVVKGDLVVRVHKPVWAKEHFLHSVVTFKFRGFAYEVASNEHLPQQVKDLICSLVTNSEWERLENFKHYITYLKIHWRVKYL